MKKIERKRTRDRVMQVIRYQVLSGAMKPGEELTQESIAEQLGLSHMSVREALQFFEQEGFPVRLPNRYMQVSTLVVEDVSHISRIIVAMATELFVPVPANQGGLLRAYAQELVRASDNVGELVSHQLLVSYLDNYYLAKAYQQSLDDYISYVILYLKGDGQESTQILNELVSTIGRGEGERVAQATQRYFLMLAQIIRQHMKDWESVET